MPVVRFVEDPKLPVDPREYAQPEHRGDIEIKKAMSFLELPIKDIEEAKKAAAAELNSLNDEADKLIAQIKSRLVRLAADYERLATGGKIFRERFHEAGAQITALDAPVLAPKLDDVDTPAAHGV